ncbi:hypothetical protein CB0940_04419 [Cercospora beticola]|uniref:Tautomerase cis-CaaD-like domain-containing protein n=1 Tax=Cercospora beticola TaxID=122368 RepID=A0A2G5HMZ4_CERBT|nr:hypothetical protein CB0940_04419 [Cercospora beticola]PIA93895.1 hypothetical protein CB0940_04419 [Cercospora beticola]WPB01659.1 hypothetical protein RHO25_006289 [Cercospora beticola]CAK1363530.1 unnamed protein product [Cercospora beticola]
MPLWRIYAHPDTFTYDQRKGIAEAITKQYAMLPAFYVNVIFVDVKEEGLWVGGETKKNFVRLTVEQIARQMPNPDTEAGRKQRTAWMDKMNETLRPYILQRPEIEWEIHIAETPRDLWRIQGIDPPPSNSEEEKAWKENNKARSYL